MATHTIQHMEGRRRCAAGIGMNVVAARSRSRYAAAQTADKPDALAEAAERAKAAARHRTP